MTDQAPTAAPKKRRLALPPKTAPVICPQCGAGTNAPCVRKDGRVSMRLHQARLGDVPRGRPKGEPPHVDDAPGITWKPRVRGRWEARWQARTDLVQRGWTPKTMRLWCGERPTEIQAAFIADCCNRLQSEMLAWARNDLPATAEFDGTLRGLIRCYQTDKDSTYLKLRYRTRQNYDSCLRRLETGVWKDSQGTERSTGDVPLAEIKARLLKRWHEEWSAGGKLYMGHGMVGILRTLFGFGATILEDDDCIRLSGVMHNMRFPMGRPRSSIITADQVVAVRKAAHDLGMHSVALAQAIQFELMLRQKDVIGEWVPMSEPGASDIHDGNEKWLRGLRWNEIDDNLILRHVTSKRQKEIEVNLRNAPMVIEELKLHAGLNLDDDLTRAHFPASGAVIMDGSTPFPSGKFRRDWRRIARAAGVPDDVKNMDTRAGAITEATDAGADLEHVRHAATHSDISMTQRYSRGAREKTDNVMQLRAKNRNGRQT